MHLKRQKAPKSWPIPRKGTTFLVRPKSNLENGIPLLILLRDVLKITENRKEVKKAIHNKSILVNQKLAREEKNSLSLFDILTIVPSKKNYRLTFTKKGKFTLEEVSENDSNEKISRVIGKKILKGKKIQLNLSDGRNVLSDMKCNTGDSVIYDFKKKKITKCLTLKKASKILVIAGKHKGETGVLKEFEEGQNSGIAEIEEKTVSVLIKQIIVVK